MDLEEHGTPSALNPIFPLRMMAYIYIYVPSWSISFYTVLNSLSLFLSLHSRRIVSTFPNFVSFVSRLLKTESLLDSYLKRSFHFKPLPTYLDIRTQSIGDVRKTSVTGNNGRGNNNYYNVPSHIYCNNSSCIARINGTKKKKTKKTFCTLLASRGIVVIVNDVLSLL